MYGIDDKGALYVHVRVFKQRRVYGEVLIKEGTVQIHCRECLRWNTVKIIKTGSVGLEEVPAPDVLANTDPGMLESGSSESLRFSHD